METEEPVKSGYLLVPGQGFLKKIWNKRYYALYGASNHGIQRLEMFDNEESSMKHSPVKIIPLTECIKVNSVLQKNQCNVFEVRTKEHVYSFSADSFPEMTDWLASIQGVAFGSGPKAPCSSTSSISPQPESANASPLISSHHEENLIYSSVDAPEVYPVTVIESEVTARCKVQGNYHLYITSVGLTLSDQATLSTSKPSLTWSFRHIRRYGYSHSTFSFEAGRKASSGEGLFAFHTKDGATIFQSIAARVDSLKTLKNDIDVTSPSATSDTKVFFGSPELSNKNTSVKGSTEQRYGLISPIIKPPRRSKLVSERLPILPPDCGNVYEDPETIVRKNVEDDYDEPERRQDAWKTLGKDNVDSYSAKDPTYDDLSYASVDAGEINGIGNLSLVSQKSKESKNLGTCVKDLPTETSNLYGKVNTKRSSNVSDSHNYENLIVTSKANESAVNDSNSDGVCHSPKHIVCNDVMYAQITRKKK